ncbi:hypothetical protein K7432_001825 [Basidiobolus ranarum]|uniref:Uncharacterized protein n=1 Tax=Basidiobolus ranarum TaxID=34480 RepID=A0ABR2W975_9FUNG
MTSSTQQYLIKNTALPWGIVDPTNSKDDQVSVRSNSLGSCFTDDHTDESDDEYWERYDHGQIQTPLNLQNDNESSEEKDYWAQYDGVGSETPPLREESAEQSTMNTAISYQVSNEFIPDMGLPPITNSSDRPHLESLDMASVLTVKLTGVLNQERKEKIKKELIGRLKEAREMAKEGGFSDQEYEQIVYECMSEIRR